MRELLVLIAAGALSLGLAGTATAQNKGQGLAIVPFAAYNIPGLLATESGVAEMKPKGAPLVGLQLELGASKAVSVGLGGGVMLGQSFDLKDLGAGYGSSWDVSAPQVYGVVSVRPAGRRPNGAVTPLAVEFGGGVAMWRFSRFIDYNNESFPAASWNNTQPFVFAGVACNLPIGPRASIQLFGRVVGASTYVSKGLDDWNNTDPPSNLKGKFNVGFLVGAGIRVGR